VSGLLYIYTTPPATVKTNLSVWQNFEKPEEFLVELREIKQLKQQAVE